MADRAVYPANQNIRHDIDICVVTDGTHHVLNRLDSSFTIPFITQSHLLLMPSF